MYCGHFTQYIILSKKGCLVYPAHSKTHLPKPVEENTPVEKIYMPAIYRIDNFNFLFDILFYLTKLMIIETFMLYLLINIYKLKCSVCKDR